MTSTSPSHRLRDLTTHERRHVQATVDSIERCVGDLYRIATTTTTSSSEVQQQQQSPSIASNMTQQYPLPSLLRSLLDVISLDESMAGGLVKTTRTVPILRQLLERRLDLEHHIIGNTDAETAATHPTTTTEDATMKHLRDQVRWIFQSSLPTVARLLRVLIISSHSRRAFHGFMQQGRSSRAFIDLLRHQDSLVDGARALSHVLQYSQDAKEVLDLLVKPASEGGGGLLEVLHAMAHDAAVVWSTIPLLTSTHNNQWGKQPSPSGSPMEVGLLTSTLMFMGAVVGVTPRPATAVVWSMSNLFASVLIPLILERESCWYSAAFSVGDSTAASAVEVSPARGGGSSNTAMHMTQLSIQVLKEECVQLACVLATTLSSIVEHHQQFSTVDEAITATSPSTSTLGEVEVTTSLAHLDTLRSIMHTLLHYAANHGLPSSPLDAQLVLFWSACSSTSSTASSSSSTALLAAGDTSAVAGWWMHHTVYRCREHLTVIRRHNLDAKAVQRALLSILHDIQQTPAASDIAAQHYAFVLGRLPGGMKTLVGTLSTVDEEVSSTSCAVLISVLRAAPQLRGGSTTTTATTDISSPSASGLSSTSASFASSSLFTDQQDLAEYRRHPVHQFDALDGILLLRDMLDDYSDDVLSGAVGILSACATSLGRVVGEMEHHGVFRRLRVLAFRIANKRLPRALSLPTAAPFSSCAASPEALRGREDSTANAAEDDEDDHENPRTLLPLSALCCDCMGRLPPPALRAVFAENPEDLVKPLLRAWWTHINAMITQHSSQSESSSAQFSFPAGRAIFPLVSPFTRWLCNVARVFGGSMVLSAIPLIGNAADDCGSATSSSSTHEGSHLWMSQWARFTLSVGGVDATVALTTSLMRVLQEGCLSVLSTPTAKVPTPAKQREEGEEAEDGNPPSASPAVAAATDAAVEQFSATIHDLACVVFAMPFDSESKQLFVFGVFWELIAEVVSVAPRPIVSALCSTLYESLMGCLRVAVLSLAPAGIASIRHMVAVLDAWGLARQDEVANLLSTFVTREGNSLSITNRAVAVKLLLHILAPADEAHPPQVSSPNNGDQFPSPTNAGSGNNGVLLPTVSKEVRETFGLLWTKIILLCEDAVDDEQQQQQHHDDEDTVSCEALANVCFQALVRGADDYIASLMRTALLVLDSILYVHPEALASSPVTLPWLGSVADADEGHDILVALVPLINGLLSQAPSCRWTIAVDNYANDDVSHNGGSMLTFFVRLISCGACLEVPLKVLGIYGLWHCLELSTTGSPVVGSLRPSTARRGGRSATAEETRIAATLRSWNILLLLAHIQREAAELQQPEEAQAEIREACYMLTERIVLLSNNGSASGGGGNVGGSADAAAAPPSATTVSAGLEDVWQFMEMTVFARGALEAQACSLLLCVLQDDSSRAYFRSSSGGGGYHARPAAAAAAATTQLSHSSNPYADLLNELRHSLRQELFPTADAHERGGSLAAPAAIAAAAAQSSISNSQAYYALLQVEKYIAEL
ncbi:Hypothetical protein, putative [Bodo saltans]|uniref:Uncharacterized protein n=1 Tax=Bodo saltans TaxID=75058 RepID=A0A0S4JKK0_BODSA|nr:Hypothetical protein, putative [Bodo saltans]|eukprot:CUG89712.1 Hypothetical protein, putative [Bodo saltans]